MGEERRKVCVRASFYCPVVVVSSVLARVTYVGRETRVSAKHAVCSLSMGNASSAFHGICPRILLYWTKWKEGEGKRRGREEACVRGTMLLLAIQKTVTNRAVTFVSHDQFHRTVISQERVNVPGTECWSYRYLRREYRILSMIENSTRISKVIFGGDEREDDNSGRFNWITSIETLRQKGRVQRFSRYCYCLIYCNYRIF